MIVICEKSKTCERSINNPDFCDHCKPHEHTRGCNDSCLGYTVNCTTILLRKDKLLKILGGLDEDRLPTIN
jgi:hypothetical protein